MAEPLRNMYSASFVKELIEKTSSHYKKLDKEKLKKCFATKAWNNASLKERVDIVAQSLHECIPGDYQNVLKILIAINKTYRPGFIPIFFPRFVELYGQDHWEESMNAMEHFTQTSSGEFAIRSFIIKDQKRTLKRMLEWSKSKNVHIRRLASEGCRPRLPWGQALVTLKKDPSPVFQILENLCEDKELYVRKSVANHLNDISKDNPEIALNLAKSWKNRSEETNWIIKHALRGLLKKGDREALELIGLNHKAKVKAENLRVTNKKIRIGEALLFGFDVHLEEKKAHTVRIEYAIDYMKSNGSHSKKIFQLSQKELAPGKHSFKRSQRMQDFTTRKHYPGLHYLNIVVNGTPLLREPFELRL